MERPECYDFGMDFLGDPEETEIRIYVEWLEKRVAELEAILQGRVDGAHARDDPSEKSVE